MRSNQCSRCQASMSRGFILDAADGGGHKVSAWVEGEPEKRFLLGIKLRGKRRLDVQTWRCTRCGFLESYAPA